MQLAHGLKAVRGIYNRGNYVERRGEIMNEWAGLILAGAPDAATLLNGQPAPAAAAGPVLGTETSRPSYKRLLGRAARAARWRRQKFAPRGNGCLAD